MLTTATVLVILRVPFIVDECFQFGAHHLEMPTEQGRNNSGAPGVGRPKRPRSQDSDSSASVCPTCEEEVSTDGVQCQWCHVWEHSKCAKIGQGEYEMLSLESPRIMFFAVNARPSL